MSSETCQCTAVSERTGYDCSAPKTHQGSHMFHSPAGIICWGWNGLTEDEADRMMVTSAVPGHLRPFAADQQPKRCAVVHSSGVRCRMFVAHAEMHEAKGLRWDTFKPGDYIHMTMGENGVPLNDLDLSEFMPSKERVALIRYYHHEVNGFPEDFDAKHAAQPIQQDDIVLAALGEKLRAEWGIDPDERT